MATALPVDTIRAKLKKPIVLIGMMGAGKTTLARRLAKALDWPFCDSDHEIERDTGCVISEIFAEKGEAAFRELEKKKVAEILLVPAQVVSVGGGAITLPETAEIIFTQSICLWVDAPIEILAARASAGGNTRPLLAGRDAREVLQERMDARRAIYMRAPIRVETSVTLNRSVQDAIEKINAHISKEELK